MLWEKVFVVAVVLLVLVLLLAFLFHAEMQTNREMDELMNKIKAMPSRDRVDYLESICDEHGRLRSGSLSWKGFCRKVIEEGEPDTERVLVDILKVSADRSVASSMLNSSNEVLVKEATQWAEDHGYEIQAVSGSSGTPRWPSH